MAVLMILWWISARVYIKYRLRLDGSARGVLSIKVGVELKIQLTMVCVVIGLMK